MKIKFLCVCAILFCALMGSCSSDDTIYSCDEEMDSWVKENLADIQNMDRAAWLKLEEEYKRPVLSAFTTEQRQLFWTQKLEEVLELDWNNEEKAHLVKLKNAIEGNPQWFAKHSEINENELDLLEVFIYSWEDDAREMLKWDNNIIGSILYQGNKVIDMTGNIEKNHSATPKLRYSGQECNCTNDWGCDGSGNNCNNSASCDKTSSGCGPFGRYKCTGKCNW